MIITLNIKENKGKKTQSTSNWHIDFAISIYFAGWH